MAGKSDRGERVSKLTKLDSGGVKRVERGSLIIEG